MQEFLSGLVRDLERRCRTLRDRLVAMQIDPDVGDHALGAYRVVEGIRREVSSLLDDPSFGSRELWSNHLQLYKRWVEQVALVENFPLPFIERYGERDRLITRLTQRLAEQVRWPVRSAP